MQSYKYTGKKDACPLQAKPRCNTDLSTVQPPQQLRYCLFISVTCSSCLTGLPAFPSINTLDCLYSIIEEFNIPVEEFAFTTFCSLRSHCTTCGCVETGGCCSYFMCIIGYVPERPLSEHVSPASGRLENRRMATSSSQSQGILIAFQFFFDCVLKFLVIDFTVDILFSHITERL
jgi:hypothetical protein